MKQISCETCGSSNLIKNDNVFICQQCGARYSLDAIKKMASNDKTASDLSGNGRFRESLKNTSRIVISVS